MSQTMKIMIAVLVLGVGALVVWKWNGQNSSQEVSRQTMTDTDFNDFDLEALKEEFGEEYAEIHELMSVEFDDSAKAYLEQMRSSIAGFNVEDYRQEIQEMVHGIPPNVLMVADILLPALLKASEDSQFAVQFSEEVLLPCSMATGAENLPYFIRAYCLSNLMDLNDNYPEHRELSRIYKQAWDSVPERLRLILNEDF